MINSDHLKMEAAIDLLLYNARAARIGITSALGPELAPLFLFAGFETIIEGLLRGWDEETTINRVIDLMQSQLAETEITDEETDSD